MNIDLVNLGVTQGGKELIVPEEFFSYRSLDSLEEVESGSRKVLIRFGVFGLSGSVYLDQDSQEVLYGLDPRDVNIVNTSVSHFTQCAVRLSEMFPFYTEDSEVDEWEAAAQRVEDAIREIDPSVYREGSFWYEFRWDVTMGDFHD
ncbi:SUKH-4 family immunity protein [Streptomyces coelicoflavus]|uniref:SUKH-4 family immunity protein n=1 Tax=Streptomyces coelicoflavus TaxID=285562 RepID=UPI0024AD0BC2|nr:SUKH-4 family immunity protein [Streptomyces coelicoflavus]MDI6521793.1 SUKH-4 family immunity protein [Streptomyces coelicoflavus]